MLSLTDVFQTDSWMNALTGLGTLARDKVESWTFSARSLLNTRMLEGFYNTDDMAARIVDLTPDEAFRPGYRVTFGNAKSKAEPDDVEDRADAADLDAVEMNGALMARIDELNANTALHDAWVWGRLYGLGAVLLLVNDGLTEDQPINEQNIERVDGLMVLERDELRIEECYGEEDGAKAGQPKTYRVRKITGRFTRDTEAVVHESRLIIFYGTLLNKTMRDSRGGAGGSVLDRAYTPLRDFQSAWRSVTHQIQDAGQGVFSVHGLTDMVNQNNTERLNTRMKIVDMGRSVARSMLVDAEKERFERQPHNLGGLEVLLDRYALRLAAAARTPVTLLMGQAPAGMNATGASDIRFWYDAVDVQRDVILRPRLERLLRLLMLERGGAFKGQEPESWNTHFNPLYQMTEAEQATVRLNTAQTDAIYLDRQVLLPEEVAVARFRPTGWSPETEIDTTVRQEFLSGAADKDADAAPTEGLREPKVDPETGKPTVDPEPTEGAAPAPGAAPPPPDAAVQQTAFTGVQTAELRETIIAYIRGEYDRDTAKGIIAIAYPMVTEEQMERALGPQGFKPTPKEPAIPFGGGAAPAPFGGNPEDKPKADEPPPPKKPEEEYPVAVRMHELVARRALADAARGRRLPMRKRVPKQTFPAGARMSYHVFLKGVVAKLTAAVREVVLPELAQVLERAAVERGRKDAADEDIDVIIAKLKARFGDIVRPDLVREAARQAAIATARHNKQQINKQLKATVGFELPTTEQFLQSHLSVFSKDNVRLITKMSDDLLNKVDNTITAAVRFGLRPEDAAERIMEDTGVSASRATLIARDQITKLNSELTQQRQTSVGITRYRWRTAGDGVEPEGRVRLEHWENEGEIFEWDSPPPTGHPGEDINCRCIAEPIVEELQGLFGSA